MGFSEMVVAICLISAVSGVLREWARRSRTSVKYKALIAEVAALREEVQQLRRQNNDVVLNLDSTVDRLGERVERLELRTSQVSSIPDRETLHQPR